MKLLHNLLCADGTIAHVLLHDDDTLLGHGVIMGHRAFYVQGVDNPGEQNIWTLYYCEERSDRD